VAKAISDSRLVRVYSGSLVDNTAELVEERKDSSSQHDIKMTVRLRVRDDSNMEGEREIVRENDCKIIYALQMQKQS